MTKGKFWGIVVSVGIVVLFFVASATIDSCQRNNRQCFGVSWTK